MTKNEIIKYMEKQITLVYQMATFPHFDLDAYKVDDFVGNFY